MLSECFKSNQKLSNKIFPFLTKANKILRGTIHSCCRSPCKLHLTTLKINKGSKVMLVVCTSSSGNGKQHFHFLDADNFARKIGKTSVKHFSLRCPVTRDTHTAFPRRPHLITSPSWIIASSLFALCLHFSHVYWKIVSLLNSVWGILATLLLSISLHLTFFFSFFFSCGACLGICLFVLFTLFSWSYAAT